MPHINHYHFHLLRILRKKELSEIYIVSGIRSFGLALIGVFIPAYLLSLGYSFDALIFYYISVGVIYGLLNLAVVKLGSKIGIKHSILLSVPFLICYLLLLNSLPVYNWSLYLIAFTNALCASLYWPAFHINFFHSSDKKYRSEEYGMYESFSYLTMILAPLLGGLIIYFFGFPVLFYIACILFILCPLPLFFSKEIHEPFVFSFKDMISQHNVRDVAVFFFEGFSHYAESVLWPIFIFVVLKNFLSLGAIATLGMLAAMMVTYVLGVVSDVVNKRTVLRVSSVCMSILWVFRSFASKFTHFAILSPLAGLSFALFVVPYMSLFYDKDVKKSPAEFVIFREFAMHALGGPIILLVFYLTKSFFATFILSGISTFAFWLF